MLKYLLLDLAIFFVTLIFGILLTFIVEHFIGKCNTPKESLVKTFKFNPFFGIIMGINGIIQNISFFTIPFILIVWLIEIIF